MHIMEAPSTHAGQCQYTRRGPYIQSITRSKPHTLKTTDIQVLYMLNLDGKERMLVPIPLKMVITQPRSSLESPIVPDSVRSLLHATPLQ